MGLLKEALQDPIVVNSFELVPFGGSNYELKGRQTGITLGNFIKTEEGYQFVNSNPFFRWFQYRFEPIKDLDEIKKLVSLIKKKY